jgi:hypothetical protein
MRRPGVRRGRRADLRQLRENAPEQVIAHDGRVGVLFDGQAIGQGQHHGDHILNGELAQGRRPPEDLLDAAGYRSAQAARVIGIRFTAAARLAAIAGGLW